MRVKIGTGKTVDIAQPSRGQFTDNLSGAIQFAIANTLYRVLEIMGESLAYFCGSFFVRFLEIIEPELVDYVAPLLDVMLQTPNLPPLVKKFLENLRHPKAEAGSALLAGMGQAAGSGIMGNILSSLMAWPTYELNRAIRPALLNPGQCFPLYWRGILDYQNLKDEMELQGYHESRWTKLGSLLKPYLGGEDMIRGLHRGILSEDDVRTEIKNRGFTTHETDVLMTMAEIIPPLPDLIRMAVREAFTPEVVQKFELGAEFPPEFGEWARKQGLSEDWAKRYWYSHWELPPIGMGFDMLHRGIITRDELATLIKTHDVSPFWRDKLIALSYSPYTRVDARRMYGLGVLNETELVSAFKDIGYDDEHATRMAQFTVLDVQAEERDLTRADVLAAYKDGRMSRGDALDYLVALRYDEQESDLLLSREDFKLAGEFESEVIKTTKTLYVNEQIDESDVYSQLGELALDAREIENNLRLWSIERHRKTERPTVTQLRDMYLTGIITEGELRSELGGHGYSEKYIGWLIQLWVGKAEG